MARGLLSVSSIMDTSPAHVIRTVRRALKMSQSEFAKELGWAPSTISRWERGEAEPSRLAIKTILAFAEERKVRYRPRAATRDVSAVVLDAPDQRFDAPENPLAVRPQEPVDVEPFVSVSARRPRWAAEARFRFALHDRPEGRQSVTTTLRNAAILAASCGAVLAIGLRGPTAVAPSAPAPAVKVARVHHRAPGLAGVAADTMALDSELAMLEAEAAADMEPAATPAPSARLESIVMIGQAGRATFRTNADAVTVTEGSWLGDRRVRRIAGDRVELVDDAGASRSVRIGDPLPPG